MTTILRLEHKVRNFDAWKAKFDSDPLGRKKAGVRRYRVSRPLDDPNYIMIELEFEASSAAEDFQTAVREMWSSPDAQRLIENPQMRIAEMVDGKEL